MTDIDNKLKRERSRVRVRITYAAAAFVFGGGALVIAYALLVKKDINFARDIFSLILPIGTGVISYWFAGRSHEKATEAANNQNGNQLTVGQQSVRESHQGEGFTQ